VNGGCLPLLGRVLLTEKDSGHTTVPVRKYVEEEGRRRREEEEEETVVTDVCVMVKNLRGRVGGSTEELDSTTMWMHLNDSTMRASPRHR